MGCAAQRERGAVQTDHATTPWQGLPKLSRAALQAAIRSRALNKGVDRMNFVREHSHKIETVYTFEEHVGEGAYGVVRRASHKKQGNVRAVKSISFKEKPHERERIQQEIQCMKQMDHPGIVRVFEVFQDEYTAHLVMELCAGGELLSKILESGRFTEVDAAISMQQIFRAVHYLHNNGVVHRDLKPDNFLLLRDGHIANNVLKLVDFGFAHAWKPGQVLTSRIGTPYYVSPQVLEGRYNNKSDTWSCGVIMYVLLLGRPPFMARTEEGLFFVIRRARLTFSSEAQQTISGDAIDLITQLLLFDENRRSSAKAASEHRWITCTAPASHRVNLAPSLVSNIRVFSRQNKLKKAALQILAAHLEANSNVPVDAVLVSDMRQIFVELDADNDGILSFQELQLGLNRAGVDNLSAKELRGLVMDMDTDNSGGVDYTEFLAATIDMQFLTDEKRCRAAFDAFDRDGDGYINQLDVRTVLSGSGPAQTSGRAKSDLDLLAQADLNGDGRIDFDEFTLMMRLGARLEDGTPRVNTP